MKNTNPVQREDTSGPGGPEKAVAKDQPETQPLPECHVPPNSQLSYPDTIWRLGDWVYAGKSPDYGTFTVTREGLREVLRLIHDAQLVAFALLYQKMPADDDLRKEYEKYLTGDFINDFRERTCDVWMEGCVVASGLFVIEGEVLINVNAEDEGNGCKRLTAEGRLAHKTERDARIAAYKASKAGGAL